MDATKILSTFRLIAIEFNDVDDEKINSMIGLQGIRISTKAFGDNYDLAVAYLTAHAFKLDEMLKGGGASSGGLTSGTVVLEKEGSYRDWETDRKSTRLNSSHSAKSRMPSSA